MTGTERGRERERERERENLFLCCDDACSSERQQSVIHRTRH